MVRMATHFDVGVGDEVNLFSEPDEIEEQELKVKEESVV